VLIGFLVVVDAQVPVQASPSAPAVPAVPAAQATTPTAVLPPNADGSSIDYSAKNGIGYLCLNVSERYQGLTNFSYGNDKSCYHNLVWAMSKGIKQGYAATCYPQTVSGESMYDFQWALYQAKHNSCAGWGCPLPCGKAAEAIQKDLPVTIVATPAPAPVNSVSSDASQPLVGVSAPSESKEPLPPNDGVPLWCILLTVLGTLLVLGAIGAFFFTRSQRGSERKKRAVASEAYDENEENPLV
jgi:hypothetical protein